MGKRFKPPPPSKKLSIANVMTVRLVTAFKQL